MEELGPENSKTGRAALNTRISQIDRQVNFLQGQAGEARAERREARLAQAREPMFAIIPASGGRPRQQISVLHDGRGNFFTPDQQPIDLPENAMVVPAQLTGTKEELGLTRKEIAGLRQSEISTRDFVDTVQDTLDLLHSSPDANTFAASAVSLVNNLKQELVAVSRLAGLEVPAVLDDPARYATELDSLKIASPRLRSLVTSLAYSRALSLHGGDGGRSISDRDVREAVKEIGGKTADPVAFSKILEDVANRSIRRFKTTYKVLLDKPFEGDPITVRNPFTAEQIPKGVSKKDWDLMTPAEKALFQ